MNRSHLADIIQAIESGQLDLHLVLVKEVIDKREDKITREWLRTLTLGNIVVFKDEVRPNYLRGAQALVERVSGTTVTVSLLNPAGRYRPGEHIKTPASLIEPL